MLVTTIDTTSFSYYFFKKEEDGKACGLGLLCDEPSVLTHPNPIAQPLFVKAFMVFLFYFNEILFK
jgi:hypothetical protein